MSPNIFAAEDGCPHLEIAIGAKANSQASPPRLVAAARQNQIMWPGFVVTGDLRRDGHAFRPEITWPDLRVVLDPETELDRVEAEYVATLRMRPAGVRLFIEGTRADDVVDTYYLAPDRLNGSGVVAVHTEKGFLTHALPALENNLQAAYNWAEHWKLEPHEARRRQTYSEIATALRADVFITDNEFALARPNRRWLFSAKPRDSLAMIGLHQRLHGATVISPELFGGVLATWQVEHTQAWSMVPALRDRFYRTYDGDDGFLELVRASGNRLKRVLGLRDKLLFGSIHPNEPSLFGDPEVLVEQVVLNLNGMLDALCRALNIALGLGMQPAWCALGRKDFRARLDTSVRRIIEDRENLKLIKLVGELRNTIHHEDLGGAGEGDQHGRTTARLVSVDDETATLLREVAGLLDRTESWIAHDHRPIRLMVRPVSLVEDLIEHVSRITQLIAAAVDWPPSTAPGDAPGEDDPKNWSLYSPTVELVNRLYGLKVGG